MLWIAKEPAMKRTVVRYRTKPEQGDENQGLIEAVFRELHAAAPPELRYAVVRLGDGTFVHFVESGGSTAALTALPAFKAFQAAIGERTLEPPQAADATLVGNYRMLDER
jgi:hypothetical protein